MTRLMILELFRWMLCDWHQQLHVVAVEGADTACIIHVSGSVPCSYPVWDFNGDKKTDLRDFQNFQNAMKPPPRQVSQ